jgi:branched-chain amino acid aminotransferase
VNKLAQAQGCQQVLWLYGDKRYVTEVGTMNVFIYMKNKQGGKRNDSSEHVHTIDSITCSASELITPPLNGLILPGVTRQSILDLANTWVSSLIQ